jgi:membrane protease subunit HflK
MAWNQPGEDKKRPAQRNAPENSSLDEMLRRWQQRVQRLWRPGRGANAAALALATLAAVVWFASGYYQIGATERGLLQRFGRYELTVPPGAGWHLPWPIETVTKLNVENIDGVDSKAILLTADQNLIDIAWSVQYRIADPRAFLFQVRDPQTSLRQASETVIRELAAAQNLDVLLSGNARAQIATAARPRIQQVMDDFHTGITVTAVNLSEMQLPDAVVAVQRDLAKAAEERQRDIADAQAYANQIVPAAQGVASHQLTDAQVYAAQVTAAADGEALRFTALAQAYAKAPEITRNRMYIETIEGILAHSRKIFIDTRPGNGSMIYLPLDKLVDAARAGAGPAAAPAGVAAASGAPTPAPAIAPSAPAPAAPGTGATAPAASAPASASGAAGGDADDGRGRDRPER